MQGASSEEEDATGAETCGSGEEGVEDVAEAGGVRAWQHDDESESSVCSGDMGSCTHCFLDGGEDTTVVAAAAAAAQAARSSSTSAKDRLRGSGLGVGVGAETMGSMWMSLLSRKKAAVSSYELASSES